ncbi:MAG: endopeptidase La [Armatimonadota bacterium]|nr:endopeptidase La [Armatimonadota bacterium]
MPRKKTTATVEPTEHKRRRTQRRRLEIPRTLPVLPVRDNVYFPNTLAPVLVGREKSLRAVEAAMTSTNRLMVLVTQRDVTIEDPTLEDLFTVGVVAEIMQAIPAPNGTLRVVFRGIQRARLLGLEHEEPFMLAKIEPIVEREVELTTDIEALMRSAVEMLREIAEHDREIPPEVVASVSYLQEPGRLADTIAHFVPMRYTEKQKVLEAIPIKERLEVLVRLLGHEVEIAHLKQRIQDRVEKELGDTQREYYLREQLKAIQRELGERDEKFSEVEEYRARIADSGMPEEIAERALKEVDRLEKMPFGSPEASVIRTYLDVLLSLPWKERTEDRVDINEAARILDEDHYGLKKVKERVLEFLAVRKLSGSLKGPILCFVGPPGVGKTSLGRSIARALGRKFVRVSLGGVRDEAEIRGHRRTYIGAMPGRIIQGLRQAGTRNPVFMLDEIDKLGYDFRGDPTSALLEALDPEQNDKFSDHYLEVPFDLSDVMFITTANTLETIPPPLRDRMEIIQFSGYTEDEKLHIARDYLIPRVLERHGLTKDHLQITDDALIRIIREYTREAGVRNLERELATICRKVAKQVAAGEEVHTVVDAERVPEFLGKPRYRFGTKEEKDEIGVAMGLAYTEFGGDVMAVEVAVVPSHEGRLLLTGRLGEVMKESAQAAMTYIRSRAHQLGIDPEFYRNRDIHIHVPEGAIPKDGPSAGITMATALASALMGRPVRRDVAMTGEITLRGRVLPVGGIKEKVIAAHRAGIYEVILPAENEADLEDIPEHVRERMTFHLVRHMDEVLPLALVHCAHLEDRLKEAERVEVTV